jgi:hypothetical protein
VAALVAYAAARALPAMPPAAGLFARGAAVVVVMGGLLWATGFFNAEELRALDALRRGRRPPAAAASVDATELAGEIVAVDVPAELTDER